MEQIYIFLADGFEEIEGLTVVDLLRRAQLPVTMVSITGSRQVTGSHRIKVEADVCFEEADFSDGTVFVLPGGMPGTTRLKEHEGLKQLLLEKNAQGKRLAAICAAPTVFGAHGLLQGKHATCYPGLEGQLTGAVWEQQEVVTDGTITTSRGMGTAIPFGLSLIAQLQGEDAASAMAEKIVFLGNCPKEKEGKC